MAILIKVTVEKSQVTPLNGKYFKLDELRQLIDCRFIDIIPLADGRLMVIDDEGKLSEDWDINLEASELFRQGRMSHHEYREHLKEMAEKLDMFVIDAATDSLDVIAGDALVGTQDEIQ